MIVALIILAALVAVGLSLWLLHRRDTADDVQSPPPPPPEPLPKTEESAPAPDIEEFRDVLLTLLPTDIAPWARSIQLRGITLPSEVREELLMIVAEARKGDDH